MSVVASTSSATHRGRITLPLISVEEAYEILKNEFDVDVGNPAKRGLFDDVAIVMLKKTEAEVEATA